MNRKSNTPKNQEANVGKTGRRSAGPKTGKKNELKRLTKEEQLELKIRAEEIGKGLTSSTWRELETAGKFDKICSQLVFIIIDKVLSLKHFFGSLCVKFSCY